MRRFALSLLFTTCLSACSIETRHRWWQTLDPAGYKHAHSEVFNPTKYRQVPLDPGEENEISELPPLQ